MVAARTHVSIFTRFFDLKSARGRGTDANRGLFDLHRHSRGREEEEGAKIGAKTLPRRERSQASLFTLLQRSSDQEEEGRGAQEKKEKTEATGTGIGRQKRRYSPLHHSEPLLEKKSNSKGGVERRGPAGHLSPTPSTPLSSSPASLPASQRAG